MGSSEQIERRRRLYVPENVRDYYRDPLRLSNAPFAAIALAASLWALHWWGLLVAAFAIAVAVLIRTWGEAKRLADEVEAFKAVEENRDDLQRDVLRLETEVGTLRRQLAAPELALPHFVHAADVQIAQINLVRKHRQLHQSGTSEWPVVAVASITSEITRFVAHATEPAQVANEPVAVVERASGVAVAAGRIVPYAGSGLAVEVEFAALPTQIQEQYLADGQLDPASFVLRLAGLMLEPLASLADAALDDLLDRLMGTTEAAARALSSGAAAARLELEEST
jgi:hypothetical protein